MRDDDEAFRRAFGLIAFAMNRHLAQHMRRLGRELETDLDAAFVWATLAHLNALKLAAPRAGPLDLSGTGDLLRGELNPLRLTDVAQVTGLPRETVRRKIVRLIELGWIHRRDNGHLFITEGALEEFGTMLSSRALVELLETADHARRLLDQDDK